MTMILFIVFILLILLHTPPVMESFWYKPMTSRIAMPQKAMKATPQKAMKAMPQKAMKATPQDGVGFFGENRTQTPVSMPHKPMTSRKAMPQKAMKAMPQKAMKAMPPQKAKKADGSEWVHNIHETYTADSLKDAWRFFRKHFYKIKNIASGRITIFLEVKLKGDVVARIDKNGSKDEILYTIEKTMRRIEERDHNKKKSEDIKKAKEESKTGNEQRAVAVPINPDVAIGSEKNTKEKSKEPMFAEEDVSSHKVHSGQNLANLAGDLNAMINAKIHNEVKKHTLWCADGSTCKLPHGIQWSDMASKIKQ